MPRFERVRFEFPCAGTDCDSLPGTVLVRPSEMVLEVEYPGELPYIIRGKARSGGFFSGRHEGRPEDVHVEAKWILLDSIYIGTWVEDGSDFVFTLRLPAASLRPEAERASSG